MRHLATHAFALFPPRWPWVLATFVLALGAPHGTWACAPSNVGPFDANTYYAGLDGLTGEALKAALNARIDGHTAQPKGCLFTILAETDEDPNNPDNVLAFYTQRSIAKSDRDFGGNTPDAWNREHIWAASHGISNSGQHGHTDLHHLRATDKSVNADREDHDFGDAPAPGGAADSECTACREDASLGIWEPGDAQKGDVARMMFYMDTRYDGDASEPTATPDLMLVNRTTDAGSPAHGLVCVLLDWHLTDPVSDAERLRNDRVYAWQGNRNPFIDLPAAAVNVYGPTCGIPPPLPIPTRAVPLPPWSLALAGLVIAILFRGYTTYQKPVS